MVAFDIYDLKKNKTGTVDLDDSVFAAVVNESFLHQVLVSYQANKRQGTAKAKCRAEVSGTRSKPFRQKGTGRARQGIWHAAHHRGGAAQFGPVPRSYRKTISKKMKQEAFRQCLSLKAHQGQCFILSGLEFPEIKTRLAAQFLQAFEVDGKALILDVDPSPNALLSIRNMKTAHILTLGSCSPLDIFSSDNVFITQSAAETLQKRYAKAGGTHHEK